MSCVEPLAFLPKQVGKKLQTHRHCSTTADRNSAIDARQASMNHVSSQGASRETFQVHFAFSPPASACPKRHAPKLPVHPSSLQHHQTPKQSPRSSHPLTGPNPMLGYDSLLSAIWQRSYNMLIRASIYLVNLLEHTRTPFLVFYLA